jgi:putative acetyltransferase
MRLVVHIRTEAVSDIGAIREVVEAAFDRPGEAQLVEALRASGSLVLSAVAVLGSRVVGHVGYSPAQVVSAGRVFPVLALAPMAVQPGFQRRGVGISLIHWSLERCRALGHGAVFVLGDPAYYVRFGFLPALDFGVHCPFPAPPEAFRALELQPGALNGHGGTLKYRPEFDLV